MVLIDSMNVFSCLQTHIYSYFLLLLFIIQSLYFLLSFFPSFLPFFSFIFISISNSQFLFLLFFLLLCVLFSPSSYHSFSPLSTHPESFLPAIVSLPQALNNDKDYRWISHGKTTQAKILTPWQVERGAIVRVVSRRKDMNSVLSIQKQMLLCFAFSTT